jgi:hypothetical protein
MIYDGAKAGILQSDVLAFDQYVFVGIGKAGAVRRPDLIYGAVVVRSQEGAGGALNNIIAVHVQVQVFLDKSAFLHPEVFADPFNVGGFETGRVVLTAIGTGEAVHFFNGFLVKLLLVFKNKVLVGLLQETGIFFLPVFRLFLPVV